MTFHSINKVNDDHRNKLYCFIQVYRYASSDFSSYRCQDKPIRPLCDYNFITSVVSRPLSLNNKNEVESVTVVFISQISTHGIRNHLTHNNLNTKCKHLLHEISL